MSDPLGCQKAFVRVSNESYFFQFRDFARNTFLRVTFDSGITILMCSLFIF